MIWERKSLEVQNVKSSQQARLVIKEGVWGRTTESSQPWWQAICGGAEEQQTPVQGVWKPAGAQLHAYAYGTEGHRRGRAERGCRGWRSGGGKHHGAEAQGGLDRERFSGGPVCGLGTWRFAELCKTGGLQTFGNGEGGGLEGGAAAVGTREGGGRDEETFERGRGGSLGLTGAEDDV